MSLLATLAVLDAAAGCYLLCYAGRKQRRKRGLLAVTAVLLLIRAGMLGHLALPEPEPKRLPLTPGRLV
jgi:hypothetical protein